MKIQRHIATRHIISYGVLNARAVNLVQPDYPPAAKAVGVKGDVSIDVVINEKGCVVFAQAQAGHLFLIPASKKAALASVFEPVFLGQRRIKVRGVIVYRYRS
ncbi:MAG TPA: hypothetical protein VJV05_13095 [Pyrinomonadaceae bacterium]|nr:hypothetical protein [Pyrinomonadaceae bacterium]